MLPPPVRRAGAHDLPHGGVPPFAVPEGVVICLGSYVSCSRPCSCGAPAASDVQQAAGAALL
eukprot:3220966-Prorocentrum_lima.AAC.1